MKATGLAPIIRANLSRDAQLMTDEHPAYKIIVELEGIASRDRVNHAKDKYVRREGDKCGMKRVYQHFC